MKLVPDAIAWRYVLAIPMMVVQAGCAQRVTVFDIVDHRTGEPAIRYRETFDEAYFDVDDAGNVDIVLRRVQHETGDGRGDLTQIIRIRCLWEAIPGRTTADSSQINATIGYHVVAGGIGASFDGAGSVFFKVKRNGTKLRGTVEDAVLLPRHRQGNGGRLFANAALSGEFYAVRDARKLVRIVNETDRFFRLVEASSP